ncbi:hypothetical protein BASA50_007202 [Batrachochytrium salamandrivorans]|uniref:Angiogenic factor with G patch and FHA domains 1 n=1 Tax=Batrachochytrium salamandrivorans TaxID=1357716 RepID=A0ABQ8F8X1_9FUNG|nr:hypothetical protein BASA62_000046 [Batrachochytrium salamandrivorans]KAH6593643.1 hypothetical protein BASA50_007202 [Batrachochytrium salamandrivorans]KAH9252375.1 hypothetical protein BASA81_009660 [Batrachochytrium salamandrivorans]KAJ1328518.1 hypothetical protein BSLG_010250 [Batrachochytrium salamandrivorans]
MGDAKREAAESKSAFSLERTSPIHSLTIEPEYDADDNAMAGGAVHGLSEYSSTDDPRFLLHTQSGWYFDTVAGTFCGWNSSGHLQYYNPAEPLTDETMRLVVKASDIVPVGSVVLVDAAGLSIGRDSNPFEKRLRLKEIAVSRCHATIYLDTSITANTDGDKTIPQDMPFCVVDTGSVHGTFVNDQRLSPSKEASAPMVLKHNDCLRLGSTVLVIHQHPRWSCSECVATALNTLEINPIQPATSLNAEKASERPQAFSKELKEKARIQELKRLKRTLTEPSLECVPHSSSASSRMPSLAEKWNADCSLLYVDRAAKRRALYSSSSDHDSTPISSPSPGIDTLLTGNHSHTSRTFTCHESQTNDTPISHSNVGSKLLLKMGWVKGQGLGPSSTGITDPITVKTKLGREGLGFDRQ